MAIAVSAAIGTVAGCDDYHRFRFEERSPGLIVSAPRCNVTDSCLSKLPTPSPQQDYTGPCHPDYIPCIPGDADDLNCDDLRIPTGVTVPNPARDPYELDQGGVEGIGCERDWGS